MDSCQNLDITNPDITHSRQKFDITNHDIMTLYRDSLYRGVDGYSLYRGSLHRGFEEYVLYRCSTVLIKVSFKYLELVETLTLLRLNMRTIRRLTGTTMTVVITPIITDLHDKST